MEKLLATQRYSSNPRPSQHHIGRRSFLSTNEGAIPPNVLEFANTGCTDEYKRYCERSSLPIHPARMPAGVPDFFIRFLTEVGDLVFDPFAGSNTTGAIADSLGRHWCSIEVLADYVEGSRGRFTDNSAITTK